MRFFVVNAILGILLSCWHGSSQPHYGDKEFIINAIMFFFVPLFLFVPGLLLAQIPILGLPFLLACKIYFLLLGEEDFTKAEKKESSDYQQNPFDDESVTKSKQEQEAKPKAEPAKTPKPEPKPKPAPKKTAYQPEEVDYPQHVYNPDAEFEEEERKQRERQTAKQSSGMPKSDSVKREPDICKCHICLEYRPRHFKTSRLSICENCIKILPEYVECDAKKLYAKAAEAARMVGEDLTTIHTISRYERFHVTHYEALCVCRAIDLKIFSTSGEQYRPKSWPEISSQVRNADGHRCAMCGKVFGTLHVHHIIPLCQNGTNHPNNLIVLCPDCHQKQHPWDISHGMKKR